MAPYFCYIHQGLYVSSPDLEGCQDAQCVAFAAKTVRPTGVFVVGFAGSTVTQQSRSNHDQFNKDMYAYEDARAQGVEPEMVTEKSSNEAVMAAEAQA